VRQRRSLFEICKSEARFLLNNLFGWKLENVTDEIRRMPALQTGVVIKGLQCVSRRVVKKDMQYTFLRPFYERVELF